MAFLKVGEGPPKAKQRLYLMEITLPSGMVVVKCGKASGESSKERMMQIVGSIYDKTRKTPMVYIKRDQVVPSDLVFKLETIMHQFFKNYQYSTKSTWSGSTECFVVPLDDMTQAYDLIVEGVVPDFTYTAPDEGSRSKMIDELTF